MSAAAPRALSVIPPMTQLNTPYPSTAYLTGFLRSRGISSFQEDLALALVLDLFSPQGLDQVRTRAQALPEPQRSAQVVHFLPEGPRFNSLDVYVDDDGGDPLAWAFGALGLQDRARHLATLYLNDLADVLRDAIDERFEFVRYAEQLAASQPSFDPLAEALAAAPNLVDERLAALALEAVDRHRPKLMLLSVPFPGSMYAAVGIAQAVKAEPPQVVLAPA